MNLTVLTNSQVQCFQTCPRKHYYRYELGVRPRSSGRALAFGLLVHEVFEKGYEHLDVVLSKMEATPDWVRDEKSLREWQGDRIKIAVLLKAAKPHIDKWDYVAKEIPFEVKSNIRGVRRAGKIDAIVSDRDSGLFVREYKTSSDDISPGSDYWVRLRRDPQVVGYLVAARALGYDVDGVIYTVIRKPRHIINKGETDAEFYARMEALVSVEPYIVEQRLDYSASDFAEWKANFTHAAKSIQSCRKSGYWPTHAGSCLARSKCEYLDACHAGIEPNNPPPNMELVTDVHPELKE